MKAQTQSLITKLRSTVPHSRRIGRALSFAALVLLSWHSGAASNALLRASRQRTIEPTSVTSFDGNVPCVGSPVKPDRSLTIVLLASTLDAEELDETRTDLLALYGQLRGRPLRLAALQGNTLETLGPVQSRSQLTRWLAAMQARAAVDDTPSVFDALRANAVRLGFKWSSVLLVGDLPELEEHTTRYAQALLARTFSTQQLRVSLLSPKEEDPGWEPVFESTGGALIAEPKELAPLLDETRQQFVEVTWTAPDPPEGFVSLSATILDGDQAPLLNVPELVSLSAELPTVAQYSANDEKMRNAVAWSQKPATPENLKRIRDVLLAAQAINPVDPLVLQTEVNLGERTGDVPYAFKAATLLTHVRPAEGESFSLLARALVLLSDFDKAEAALNKAAALQVPPSQLAEQYARLRLGRKDERGALPYLAQALAANGKRQDLWYLQAGAAEDVHDLPLAIHSLEQGLALSEAPSTRSITLLKLYAQNGQSDMAKTFAAHTVDILPADATLRAQFAEALDQAKLPAESLAAWRSVLAVQPQSEQAHTRIAELLLISGDAKGAEAAAALGLQSAPTSGSLVRAKAEAVTLQGRAYEGRGTLEQGASITNDVVTLAKLAAAQELYGDRAAEVYLRLANLSPKESPTHLQALENGFGVALRDGDLKRAAVFAAALEATRRPEYRLLLGEKRLPVNETMVPGGLAAFSFAAHIKTGIPPEHFFAEYAHHVIAGVCTNCIKDHSTQVVQEYFSTIAELETQGKRVGNRVSITLSLDGKEEKNRTQNVLRLLGLQLHIEKGKVHLDRGEKQSQSQKQDILTGLGIDEVGLQEALQAAKPFTFDIVDESVPIYPSAKAWKEAFPKQDQRQFALFLLRSPEFARLYAGISTLDRGTLQALIGNSGLYWFLGHPAEMLALYGTSFAVEGKRAAVPGGTAAIPVWTQMVGPSPAQAGPFYQALLQKNPSLLAYFYALSHLDFKHQVFFTANITRANRFYTLFSTMPEAKALTAAAIHDSSFSELLSSVPLDVEGHVDFPGSPEVWTVAKGKDADEKHMAKMLKKVSRAASPDVEDEVLLHLLDLRYKSHAVAGTELDNFLAVARIDAHRTKPLDEESALLLAQSYSEFSAYYPYFTDLTSIDAAGFRSFFNLIGQIRHIPAMQQQMALGQLNSLVEWVVLIHRRKAVDDAEAARLFASICDRMASANGESSQATISIDLAEAIMAHCGRAANAKWDDALRACLLGPSADGPDRRGMDYRLVLDEQKAPGLDQVRSIVLAARSAGTARLTAIARGGGALPAVLLPKEIKISPKEKEALLLYDPANLQKLIDEWNANVAHSTRNAKSAKKLAGELLKAVEPQIALALAAPVYAYFFRSNDLVISDDPLLLRKHRFFNFVSPGTPQLVEASVFVPDSEGLGSHLEGGFAQFALASGFAVASGWKQGGQGGPAVIAEQLAAIRSANWDQATESDQRLVTLRVLAAREWIVQSAQDAYLAQALNEETSGLLSLSRRADLLNGIAERDWQQVWTSITLPDLFRLGSNYLARFSKGHADTPVAAQLRAVTTSSDGARLDIFARIPNHVLGCGHTHLVLDQPYEEYERQIQPTYMAERAAEFKLFLVYRADSLGVPPAALPRAAESLARKAFSISRMNDYNDWRSLLTAFASITNENLKNAIEP